MQRSILCDNEEDIKESLPIIGDRIHIRKLLKEINPQNQVKTNVMTINIYYIIQWYAVQKFGGFCDINCNSWIFHKQFSGSVLTY